MNPVLWNEIRTWRDRLAADIRGRHPQLPSDEVRDRAERLIEGLLFLAICRARGVPATDPGPPSRSGRWVLRHLNELLGQTDTDGTGRSVHAPDGGSWQTDAQRLEEAFRRLTDPESPWELASAPDDLLGQIHEGFLRGDAGRGSLRRRGEPVERRAGGVYYTPGSVVDYIVRSTVGAILKGKTPRDAARLRILDPACGGGAFLLGAYRYLLDWHRQWYASHDPERYARAARARLQRDAAGAWQLTAAERRRILRKSLFGVDIDGRAVEVTRQTLFLTMLGSGPRGWGPSLGPGLRALNANIKCGNALVSPGEYRASGSGATIAPAEVCRIKPFDWQAEFPGIWSWPAASRGGRRRGGFDMVIGNPPYRKERGGRELLEDIVATPFGREHHEPRMDLWYYFVYRGLDLLKPGGVMSLIVPAYWVASSGARKLMATLRDRAHVDEVFFLDRLKVFPGVSGRHMILRVSNAPRKTPVTVRMVEPETETDAAPFLEGRGAVRTFRKRWGQFFGDGRVDLQPPADSVLEKLDQGTPLGQLGRVRQGIVENPAAVTRKIIDRHGRLWEVGTGVFALRPDELAALDLPPSERRLLRPYHDLGDLGRYGLADQPSLTLIYSTRGTCPDIRAFPRLARHLARFRPIMEGRRETRSGRNRWWHLHWPRDERLWQSPKILCPQMAARPSLVPAARPVYVPFSVNVFARDADVPEHENYLCGLLNSRPLWKWYQHHAKQRGIGLEIAGRVLARSPIRRIRFSRPADRRRHDRIVELVQEMLDLHGQQQRALTGREERDLGRRIAAVDRQIDSVVYELYRLDDQQITLVEQSTRRDEP